MAAGGGGVYILNITPLNGFNPNSVSYSVSGLPSGVTASFNPSPTPNTPFMEVAASTNAPLGSYSLTVTGTSGSLIHTASTSLKVQTGGLIAGASQLHQNLGPMPFDSYDFAHQSLQGVCPPSATSVRACYQAILANYKAQGVTGVRFQFGFCGGGSSTPLQNCGQSPSNITLSQTWVQNVTNFFSDLYNAGIYKITPTPEFTDWFGVADSISGHYQPNNNSSPKGPNTACPAQSAQSMLQFPPATPYGQIVCHPNPTGQQNYWCKDEADCQTCQANAGYPTSDYQNQTNQGYNCSPVNPIFVGWSNLHNVINAMIGAAAAQGLSVIELDVEQEMSPLNFTVQARFILDNQTSPAYDVYADMKGIMSQYGFDPLRVISSAGAIQPMPPYTLPAGYDPPNVAGFDCTDVYQTSARTMWVGSVASAIQGGWFGVPVDDPPNYPRSPTNGFWCGGAVCGTYPSCTPSDTGPGMIELASGHTGPDILDIHTYPEVAPPTPLNPSDPVVTYTDNSYAQVQVEAVTDFNDMPAFLTAIGTPNALLIIGETHSNTTNPNACGVEPGGGTAPLGSCECAPAPPAAASQTVTGYNASSLAGRSVVFRPWSDLQASCYSLSSPYATGYQP